MQRGDTISHRVALRWGHTALIAALVGSLGLIGVVALKAPQLVSLLPIALVGVCVVAFLFTKSRLNFIVWLAGLAVLFSKEEGIQLHEAVYGLYFYAFLAHWYGRRLLLYRQKIIRGPIDMVFALWLVLGVGLGTALGLLFGADLISIRGEAISLTMLAIYFPIKEFCIREKYGPAIILSIIAWIGIWVTIDNLLVARQTFAEATQLWEIADVRTAGRELLLTFSGILILSILPTVKEKAHQVGLAALLAVLLAGLILTKSRAYWVEFVVAVIVLIAINPGRDRRQLIAWCITGTTILALFSLLFFSSYVNLLIVGASARFATIGAASGDLSLINRFVEAEAVMKEVWRNPILGYGLGTDYSFYDIIFLKTLSRSYIHNGVVAVLYKFGLWGAFIVAYAWLSGLFITFRDARRTALSKFDRTILRGIFACLFSMALTVLTTSVFFEDEKLAAFVLVTALGMGVHYRNTQAPT